LRDGPCCLFVEDYLSQSTSFRSSKNKTFQEGLDLLQDMYIIGVEKWHNSIFKQEFVRKHNDKVNIVFNILILGWDRECQVEDIWHWQIAWDAHNHKIHFLFWGDL
jgi:hypothetical protein